MGQHGKPHWLGTRFMRVTTDAAPVRERFDFWHSLFSGVDMAPLASRDRPYDALALNCAGDDGVVFTDMACDPIAARFGEDEIDHMRISVLTRGRIDVAHGRDDRDAVGPGPGIHLFDCARPAQADSPTGYHAFHVTLPRAEVYRAMGADPIAGVGSLRTLPDTPLSLLLKDQLCALARYGPAMDAGETEAAMKALSGLTLAYLQRFHPRPDEAPPLDQALFAAACRYIDACKEHSGLTAEAVARAVGCSRARLYRLFERRGLAVSEYVRDVRLNHSRALLRDPALDIGDVSLRCGYGDLSAFGKAFRRRFGMTPRDWRMTVT